MNPNTPKNWALDSYTNDTWTDLVAEEAIISSISVANTTAVAIDVQIRLADGSGNVASIIPSASIDALDALVIDMRSVVVLTGQKIQVQAPATGMEFLANGAVEEAA